MDFDAITALGLAAAALTTAAFLPQVIKTWRTRQTRDISLGMVSVLRLGIILWFTYGIPRRPCGRRYRPRAATCR